MKRTKHTTEQIIERRTRRVPFSIDPVMMGATPRIARPLPVASRCRTIRNCRPLSGEYRNSPGTLGRARWGDLYP